MKFRKKMTAILLTAIFMTSAISLVVAQEYIAEVTTVLAPGHTASYPADVTVEDIGSAIRWTFDMVGDKTLEGDGHWGASITISFDGVTPDIHVHNNDGTCSAHDDGTWLYSPYDEGWHTSDPDYNTPVSQLSWVSATGDRYYANNPTGIFTITVDKTELPSTFYWAVYVSVGGFYAPNNGYSSYPEGFTWTPTFVFEEVVLPPPTRADALRAKGVPGKGEGIDEAPGLRKSPPNDNFAARERKGHAHGHAYGHYKED